MEYIEIILVDFPRKHLDPLVYDVFKISSDFVKSSNFYDNQAGKSIDYVDLDSIERVLRPKGSGTVLLNELNLGVTMKNVLVLFSFDEEHGDIFIHVEEEEFYKNETDYRKLLIYLFKIQSTFHLEQIRIGFEPATDEDMRILDIDCNSDMEQSIAQLLHCLHT
ncbi:hypothetical protein SAMN04487866_12133 [Thermoactinomyces sp. DSM 45891]|uniref:hypothetical protein n=1 Tax=Thermoactinomyces sp. DSM 45891 TaxID=1761907 RepID=UPI00091D6B50|nr:hypothetical protein [Thermoactinomyces sp. DSM 45891]SFX74032.1 hypothetical protein SAMN04487866_12133 [Thermoactinomyces sp. DSM 45891]